MYNFWVAGSPPEVFQATTHEGREIWEDHILSGVSYVWLGSEAQVGLA